MPGSLAILGRKQEVLPFLATGAIVCIVEKGEAEKKVHELVSQGVRVVFFAEDLAEELKDVLHQYQTRTFPCLIPYSTGATKRRIAIERLRGIIKKAVGADIFLEAK